MKRKKKSWPWKKYRNEKKRYCQKVELLILQNEFKVGVIMFIQPDHTYRDIQEKSFQQWLDEMEQHEDLAVSGGVKLVREYVQYLKDEIKRQEESNQLKIDYMKKLKNGR